MLRIDDLCSDTANPKRRLEDIEKNHSRTAGISVALGLLGTIHVAVLTVLWTLVQDIFRLGPNVELEVYTQLLLLHDGAFPGRPLPHACSTPH
jgi:hypothetical protein